MNKINIKRKNCGTSLHIMLCNLTSSGFEDRDRNQVDRTLGILRQPYATSIKFGKFVQTWRQRCQDTPGVLCALNSHQGFAITDPLLDWAIELSSRTLTRPFSIILISHCLHNSDVLCPLNNHCHSAQSFAASHEFLTSNLVSIRFL